MAFENLCMYCFEETGGADVCPHCGRDARAAVPQIQLLPGTLVYNDRFLIGRALGQDASGIVYAALDTRKNVKIRIREYLPRDCARRLNSGEVVPEPGAEDQFESGMNKLRASVEGVDDPSKRHFFFEENGTGYIAQRKAAGGSSFGDSGDEESDHRGARMAMVVGLAAVLVLAVAVGVIALVNYFTSSTDRHTEAPMATGQDIWQVPESPTPTPYAAATFAAITDPTHSWMDFTNPDLSGNASDYAKPTPAPTPEGGLGETTINSKSDPELIKKLQILLVDLGWLDESGVTGKYDDATRQAVKDFQQYMNDTFAIDPKLTVDGIVGKKTLTWLLKTDVSMKPTPTPVPVTPSPTQAGRVIDENSSPEEIKYVQLQLARLGILTSDQVDGKYGAATRNGVKAFQMRVNDLLKYDAVNEDGVCDDRTLAYLDYYVEWWENNQPTPTPTQTPEATLEPNEAVGEVIDENSNKASIKRVQEMLIDTGYLKGTADGVYGSKTYAAVGEFQQYLKDNIDPNVEVTGKCDVLTREYLERFSAESEPSTEAPTAGSPQITVTGAQAYNNNVYVVGEEGVRITWNAKDVSSFCIELTDIDGNMINKEASTPYTALTLYRNNLSSGQPNRFTVTSLNSDGSRGESSYVYLAYDIENGEATAEPAAAVPQITVTGALSYADGVYRIGENGAGLTWYAEGSEKYSLYISNAAGEIIYSSQDTRITEYNLKAENMLPDEKYTFSIVAIPAGGMEADGESASVRLMLDVQANTPEPTVEPSTDFSAPTITVDALGEIDGVYYVGETAALISWHAEGEVRAYTIYLTNSNGDKLSSLSETDKQSMTVDPATMKAEELYTITVIAIPVNGYADHGKSSQVQIMLYTGQTSEPTEEPVAEIGMTAITVSGHTASEGNTYYAGKDGMTVAWKADGDVAGYDVLVVDSDDEVIIDRTNVTNTSMTVNPVDLDENVAYTFTVTAVPKGGTSEDGNSASVVIIRASAPEMGAVEMSVSGHADMEDDVYHIGADPINIAWSCENAVGYSVYLSDSDNKVIKSVDEITDTELIMGTEGLEADEVYTLTIKAHSVSGKEEDSVSASILLMVQPVQKPSMGVPEINVSGYIDYKDSVFVVDESGASVSWSAENAEKYNVGIYNSDDEIIRSVDGTSQTTLNIDTAVLEAGEIFTIEVTPVDAYGEEGGAAYVQFMRIEEEPTPEPTAEPTPEPVEVGKPEFVVNGYADEQDGIYIVGEESVNVSWTAENAAVYSIYVYNSSKEVITSAEKKNVNDMDVNPSSLPENEVITVAVTGYGEDGTEGETGYVQLMRMEEEPTPEPTAEPTPEPIKIGTPEFVVTGYVDEQNGVYVMGGDPVNVSWTAENAEVYSVYIYNSSNEVINSAEKKDIMAMDIKPSSMPAGEIVTIAVYGIGADDVKGETGYVQLMLPAAEPTPEPTPEPTEEPGEVDAPVIEVAGYTDVINGVYIVGEDNINVSWSAENAVAYDVAIYNGNGDIVKSVEGATTTSMELKSASIAEDDVFTISVISIGADGSRSDEVIAVIARNVDDSGTVKPITPESDVTQITQLQTQLYKLGWITEDSKTTVQVGTLDDITIQAIYEFQNYLIMEGINPEIVLIDPMNPYIDEVTITALFDTLYPVYRPQ